MNLSAPYIRRPIMTTLMMTAILFVGILSFLKLPVADLPSVDYPTLQVSIEFPGASPETMASSVASPLEKQFMTIQGIESVTSSNTLGRSLINLQFDISKNLDVAAVDVQTAIAAAQNRLPNNLPNPPTYKKINPSDTPIIYIAVTSETQTLAEMYKYAYTFIGQRLSIIPGVAQVVTYGAPYALRVNIDPDLIAAKGITLADIAAAIKRAVPNLPSGQLDGSLKTSIIRSEGQLINAAEMNPVIVRYQEGAPVRIEDIGEAIDSLQNIRFQLKYHEADKSVSGVVIAVEKQPGANTLNVARQVKAKLPELITQIPSGMHLDVIYDKSLSIEASVFDVEMTLILALILVVAVIFVYLGKVADTIIPSLSMPMSIVLTFIIMQYFNFTLDNLSLLALVLATGFIVDDAIVVLENVVRRIEGGESRWQASLEGAKQISFTIVSMTLSLAAVFIPLVFMYGLVGRIFYEFSVVMVTVILASGIISLTLTPMLASRFIATRKNGTKSRMEAFSSTFNDTLLSAYKRSLSWVMNHQYQVLVVGLASVLLSIFLFWYLPKDFLPDDDIGFMIAFTQAAEGTSPEQMFRLQSRISEVIQKNPNVKSFVSVAGNPQSRQGVAFIVLKPYSERASMPQVMGELYKAFAAVPGINVFLKNIPLINLSIGIQARGAYQYTLSSLDTEALYKSADVFIQRLSQESGFVGVSSDLEVHTPELKVEILRDQASSLGVDADDIESALLLAFGGGPIAEIDTPYDQYDIILELLPSFREKTRDLSSLWIPSRKGTDLIPLSSVARWTETTGPASINHLSQFPSVTVQFNLMPHFPLSKALSKVQEIAKDTLPADVIGESQGAASTFESSIATSAILFLLSIFAIYIVLGILYESFIHPLTILSSLPPAILGGLITLWFLDLPLSLYSYLGLMLLIGIVKKNGILVVDFAIDMAREKGETPEASILEACSARFRPIMMTTLAAIMGALPIALGFGPSAEARRPLGLVIIGGLLVSQLITLYLTPIVYLHLEKYNRKFSPEVANNS